MLVRSDMCCSCFKSTAANGHLSKQVVAYGISINLVEVTWKSKIKQQFPNPNDYSQFMGNFSTATGSVTFLMMLLSRYIFRKFGWGVAAAITPTVLLITGENLLCRVQMLPRSTKVNLSWIGWNRCPVDLQQHSAATGCACAPRRQPCSVYYTGALMLAACLCRRAVLRPGAVRRAAEPDAGHLRAHAAHGGCAGGRGTERVLQVLQVLAVRPLQGDGLHPAGPGDTGWSLCPTGGAIVLLYHLQHFSREFWA